MPRHRAQPPANRDEPSVSTFSRRSVRGAGARQQVCPRQCKIPGCLGAGALVFAQQMHKTHDEYKNIDVLRAFKSKFLSAAPFLPFPPFDVAPQLWKALLPITPALHLNTGTEI